MEEYIVKETLEEVQTSLQVAIEDVQMHIKGLIDLQPMVEGDLVELPETLYDLMGLLQEIRSGLSDLEDKVVYHL